MPLLMAVPREWLIDDFPKRGFRVIRLNCDSAPFRNRQRRVFRKTLKSTLSTDDSEWFFVIVRRKFCHLEK